jgi:hypothetical protein
MELPACLFGTHVVRYLDDVKRDLCGFLMGFFQILRSVEDLLYQVMTWLVFYPRTLWQVIRHPVRMIDYSDREQGDAPDQQYIDTLSPPLFLMLTILISHGIELALQTRIDTPKAGVGKLLLDSEENLLMLRSILFSIYPLTFAVGLLKRSDRQLDRNTLRAPFFSQCYLGGLLAFLVSVATIISRAKFPDAQWIGAIIAVAVTIWFVWVQSKWFAQHLKIARFRATMIAIRTFVKASIINSAIASLFFV